MKRLLFVCGLLLSALFSFAQTDPLRQKLDSVFQHVNKSLIPTDYLKEYGAELTPLHRFNGALTDSNLVSNLDAFRLAYTDLATAKIQ
ncbi:MAG: Por secretion system C-terminal sorting protein [Flaviaesturariibacter sp.]|nr:Por secretion system C-terminal sorting protein [Flaviaesturariibacter sp.]